MKPLSLAAFAFTLALATGASAQRPLPSAPHPNDDKLHVDAYGAVEYTTIARQWEGTTVRGLSRQPYVLKVADIHLTNFGRFEAGLNAAATSLAALGGFTQPESSSPDLEQAERYAGLIGYAIKKKITLLGQAHYARLTTFAAPEFQRNANFPRTTYYYPDSGPAVRLHPGAIVAGNTEWYALSVTARFDGDVLSFLNGLEIGYRYFRLTTLSAYAVGPTGISSPAEASFLAVAKDTFSCHTVAFNSKIDSPLGSDIFVGGEVHGGLGYSQVSSNLADSAGGVCINYGGTLGLELRQPSWAFGIGYTFDQISSLNFSDEHALSQDVKYIDPSSKRVQTATSGSTWSVLGPAQSIVALGPFARLTLSF